MSAHKKFFSILAIFFTFALIFFIMPNQIYAQVGGTGVEVIRPIEKLWQLMRNISYLVVIIIMIVLGLMIMFRAKLNQQTVVGVQQALPGIIIALVTITFSYIIASLIIDIAFLLGRVFGIAVITTVSPPSSPAHLDPVIADGIIRTILNDYNIFDFFVSFITGGGDLGSAAGTIGDAIRPIFEYSDESRFVLAAIVGFLANQAGGGGVLGNVATLIGLGSSLAVPDRIVALLVYVILFISLLFSLFNLLLGLIGAYVSIILNIIFAPFIILASALPGRSGDILNWAKGLLANVLVFPVIFGLFILVAALLNRDFPWQLGCGVAVAGGPPVCPVGAFNQPLPLFGTLPENLIRFIIAYGMLLAAPGIPGFLRNVLGVRQPEALTGAVQQSTSTGQQRAQGVLTALTRRRQP